jgi:hypothetical protein
MEKNMENEKQSNWIAAAFLIAGIIGLISDSQVLNVRMVEDIYVIETPAVSGSILSGKAFLYRSGISHGEINEIVNDRLTIYFKSGLAFRVTTNPGKHQQDFEMNPDGFRNLIKWLFKSGVPIFYYTGELAKPDDLMKRLEANGEVK